MQHQLINHSPDLKRLRDEGYELQLKGGYVCIHHIPYVNSSCNISYGTLISDLTITGGSAGKPSTHVVYFMGDYPCHKDGSLMIEIVNSSPNQQLGEGLLGNHCFSSKPESGSYANYYDKFTRYISLLSAPARSLQPGVTAATYRPYLDEDNSPFHYFDSNSSRANINQLNAVFKNQKIGIIGLGGTGSYILDLVAKTPVAEIHLYDGDVLSQHNAFRSPGAPSFEALSNLPSKSSYFSSLYSNMHKHIFAHEAYINEENIEQLRGLTHVFVCVDKNSVRSFIIEKLLLMNITFIDVGLGVNLENGKLIGILRTTAGTSGKNDHLIRRISSEDEGDNEYSTNIQIADLNAMNACKAVEKWKKLSGFYHDDVNEHHSTYTINASLLVNGDIKA